MLGFVFMYLRVCNVFSRLVNLVALEFSNLDSRLSFRRPATNQVRIDERDGDHGNITYDIKAHAEVKLSSACRHRAHSVDGSVRSSDIQGKRKSAVAT